MRENTAYCRRYFLFLILLLGLLSAFGPFVTDMYLPAMPTMANVFNTTTSSVQLGLTTSMLGLAIGQLLFGPLSDKFGRKPVLVVALLLFGVSTVASIYSPTIEFFNICRFVQGLGGAGGIVMSRSISTDCYSGRELARTLAIVGAVNGVAPVTAPVIGGLVSAAMGWQGIFWTLFAIGVLLLGMCIPFRESLPEGKRHRGKIVSLMAAFPALLAMKPFRTYVLLCGFVNGVLFSYISSASFIIQNHYGFSEMMFALFFGINAAGIAIGAALALKFKRLINAATFGACMVLLVSVAMLVVWALTDSFVGYEAGAFLLLVGCGFIFTSVTTLAMDAGRSYIGAASAIFGATAFLFGGVVSPLVGLGDIMPTTLCIIVVCSVVTLFFALIARKV